MTSNNALEGRLSRRTVVTGGTRGIGAAVVRRIASAGPPGPSRHEVVALGRLPGAAPPPWAAGLGEAASAVRFDGADAASFEECAAAFARANDEGHGLTGLVVSAGIWEPSPVLPVPAAALASFERVVDVNLLGAVRAVLAFAAHVRRDAGASIVLVGSTAGQRGEPRHAAYAASKAALAGLAKSWAVELAPLGCRVNVVAPGWVDTDMTARALGDAAFRARVESEIPRGRVASAEDLAGPVAFLLAEDSLHVTGSVISANGGAVLA